MAHAIEPATSGRAKCRGCGKPIPKGELRLGERLPNPFAEEGEMTLWFHLDCGAYKRPQALLEGLETSEAQVESAPELEARARQGLEHPRLPRVDGVERSPTGRAACRHCRETIPKASWRIRLVFFEEGRFVPSGFIHVACAQAYLGSADLIARLKHFSKDLEEDELAALARDLQAPLGD